MSSITKVLQKLNPTMLVSKTIVTLTTIPSRLNNVNNKDTGIITCLDSLCQQEADNYEVHINIPTHYAMHGNIEYIIPDYIKKYEDVYPHFKIFRVKDIGPVTKIIPTIERVDDPDAILLVVDDDMVYSPLMVREHLIQRQRNPGTAIGYAGLNTIRTPDNIFKDPRDRFATVLPRTTRVAILEHYKSASYNRGWFKDDIFSEFIGKTGSDDILISAYLGKHQIPKIVPHAEEDGIHLDYSSWERRVARPTFPIVRPCNHGTGGPEEGTRDPAAEDLYHRRFYTPKEWEATGWLER